MTRIHCPVCRGSQFWKLSNGERRCRQCRKDLSPYPVCSLRLTREEWQKITELFLFGVNSPVLQEKTGRSMGTILKAFRLLRQAMYLDVPEKFSGIVEVDETYLGGQWKNKRKSVKRRESASKRGRGTTKQPVFGILAREGTVWAEVVADVEKRDLEPLIRKQVKRGSTVCSDTWRAYTGLATRGYVHRTVEHAEREFVRGATHINGLEGFFGYLKRKLASKGGIRREYLPLFLGEYVWRYNHRRETTKQQRDRLLKVLYTKIGAGF